MALKEMYEEMSNEELLDRYKDFQDYRDEAKVIILEELRKRKIVSEEEMEKKLNSFRKYEQEKVREEKKVEAKSKENNENNNKYFYFNNRIEFNKRFPKLGHRLTRGDTYIAMILFAYIVFLSILNISSLFYEETKGKILQVEDGLLYEYQVGNKIYKTDRICYGSFFLWSSKETKLKKDNIVKVWYSKSNYGKSSLYKGIPGEVKFFLIGVYFIIIFTYASATGYLRKSYVWLGLGVILFFLLLPNESIVILG